MSSLEVLFTPADFSALHGRDLSRTVCVVFDVLRATSTVVTALGNGATSVIPVLDIPEALAARAADAQALLAGEREGVRIRATLTGSIDFDLGNSPREFTPEKIRGRTIVMTTTNGTRALRACAGGRRVLACSFLNLQATADFICQEGSTDLLVICSGTHEEAAYEDVLGAGALCALVWDRYQAKSIADSALMARTLFDLAGSNLDEHLADSRNGRRLLEIPELRDDVGFCAQRDCTGLVAELGKDGRLKRISNCFRASA